jgi:hypothetical protein
MTQEILNFETQGERNGLRSRALLEPRKGSTWATVLTKKLLALSCDIVEDTTTYALC